MGVQWNGEYHYLYSQVMDTHNVVDWFQQIIRAVETEYGYSLYITEETEWNNITESTKNHIMSTFNRVGGKR